MRPAQLIVNLVNPRFVNFSQPLLVAVLVGASTLALTGAFFAWEFSKQRCSSLNFPTPQPNIEVKDTQYTSGFTAQADHIKNLRFGGSVALCENNRCGVRGTFESSGVQAAFSGDGDWDSVLWNFLPPSNTPMFFIETTSTETLLDYTNPAAPTSVTVTTKKTSEYAVCVSNVEAFIVADVSRDIYDGVATGRNPNRAHMTGEMQTLLSRPPEWASNTVHVHPQVGSWPCNPPTSFYELKHVEMGGEPFFADDVTPGVGHTSVWVDDPRQPRLATGTYQGVALPICGVAGPQGDFEGPNAGQPPPLGASTMPFYHEESPDPNINYQCTPIASTNGRELPVMASYRTFSKTSYNVTWGPDRVCVPTPLATAVGTALAYSTYFELLCTLLILAVLLQLGMVKMVGRASWNEVASGDLSVDALAKRITQLESKGASIAA